MIAYLVFFLSGLSYGLAQQYQLAVNKWGATDILLSDKANETLAMSMIDPTVMNQVKVKEKAVLSQTPGIILKRSNSSDKQNVSFFGIKKDEFLVPNVVEGKMFAKKVKLLLIKV